MASAVQYAIVLLSLAVAMQECGGISQKTWCLSNDPCFDLLLLEKTVWQVSKDVPAADSENILLKSQTFDKIRKRKGLHSCVLLKIIDFYVNVISYPWNNSSNHISHDMNYHLELILMMNTLKSCVYKMNKICEMLYQKAAQQPNLEISEADMTPEEVAIHQLQKLNFASDRLNDTSIQERAMDELKSLHNYIPGRGFRKTNV
ncbi:uncharacterized protein si:ch211-266a5.12 [Pygocentrus nattereri]|uniref:uncharacterized protein si:ch211-266a5.12 n=1 Tax=Pygocentrus nattereri TaxID=42514 RepID=UPI000814A14A|nr:uncharacterized protein si:ch211-266a5.12 [Pygocentrus nattereri]